MKQRRGPNPAAESRGAAGTGASQPGTQGQSPKQAGGVADGLRRWPGADARTGYESRAGFQPGCSQFPSQLATRVGRLTPCPGKQEKKTLPCDEATGRLDWKRSSADSAPCSYERGAPSQVRGSRKRRTTTRTPTAALHTCAAQDRARGARLLGRSCKEGSRRCRVLPCHHLSLLPRQLRIMENNSFRSTRTEFFLKECLPQMGTISFYTSNQVYLTLKEN